MDALGRDLIRHLLTGIPALKGYKELSPTRLALRSEDGEVELGLSVTIADYQEPGVYSSIYASWLPVETIRAKLEGIESATTILRDLPEAGTNVLVRDLMRTGSPFHTRYAKAIHKVAVPFWQRYASAKRVEAYVRSPWLVRVFSRDWVVGSRWECALRHAIVEHYRSGALSAETTRNVELAIQRMRFHPRVEAKLIDRFRRWVRGEADPD